MDAGRLYDLGNAQSKMRAVLEAGRYKKCHIPVRNGVWDIGVNGVRTAKYKHVRVDWWTRYI